MKHTANVISFASIISDTFISKIKEQQNQVYFCDKVVKITTIINQRIKRIKYVVYWTREGENQYLNYFCYEAQKMVSFCVIE